PLAFAVGFGDFHSSHRGGRIRPAQELGADGFPMPLQVLSQLLCGHPVDTRRASVAFYRKQRSPSVERADDLFHQFLVRRFLWGGRRTGTLGFSAPGACGDFIAWASVCQTGVVTAVVASRCFGKPYLIHCSSFPLSFVLLLFVLRSSQLS